MRFLRVSQHLYPDVTGGMPYHVHAMSRDQAAMGHDVTVLTTRNDDALPREETRDGYDIRRVDSISSPLGNDIAPGLVRYLRDSGDIDVVHAHSHYYLSSNLAALNRRLGSTPMAMTNHGVYSQSAPAWLFRWYLKTLGRWTFNAADRIFCYSDVDRHRLRQLGVTSSIDVIHNGIDTERFTPDGPMSSLIDVGDPVLLSVGRLVDGKRPELALKAFASYQQMHPDPTLYFCGDGPLRDRLQRKASALGVADSVVFLGSVPYDEMPAIYRSADVCLLPSRFEGVPRTALEAMATNVPVVAADLEQLPKHLDAVGHRVDDFSNSAAVATAIEHVANGVSAASRATIENGYRWSETVSQTTDRLETIAQSV